MKRREFITLLGGTAAWPLVSLAQQPGRKPLIGYLAPTNPGPVFGYFKDGMQKLGYVEGKSIQIELRSAEGNPERLAGLAQELVRLKVDILVAWQTPATTAAKNATTRIPIVMAGTGDPVATGLIASLARPGGNITGTGGTTPQLGTKVLELVREVLPRAKRVGVLANATDPFTRPFLEQLRGAGPVAAVEIDVVMIRETAELDGAIANLAKRRADAVIVQPSLQRRVAAEIALKHRLAAVAPSALFPEEGGLFGYSAHQPEQQRVAAVYVDKILKGAKPADLPVQQPTKFELVVNLKTAKALGITVPRAMLLRADKVIE